MGTSARGQALRALGRNGEAIAALGAACLLYHDLRLRSAEYANVRALAELLAETGRGARAKVAVERALQLARELGDAQGVELLTELAQRL